MLIKELKNELTLVLFGDKEKEFKNDKEISYFDYLTTIMCCCFSSQNTKNIYKFELNRVKKILNIETFQHFLTESYAIKYKKLDEKGDNMNNKMNE